MVDRNRIRENIQRRANEQFGASNRPEQRARIAQNINTLVSQGTGDDITTSSPQQLYEQRQEVGPVDATSRRERMRDNINARVQAQPVVQPETPQTIGGGVSAPTFGESYGAGLEQFGANIDYSRALVNDLLGDEQGARDAIRSAQLREEMASGQMAGAVSYEDLKNDPTLGGGLQFAKQTLAQMAPFAIESTAYTLAGALVGGAAGGPGGAVAGGAASGSRALATGGVNALLRKAVKDQIVRETREEGVDNATSSALSAGLRARAAQRGAYMGGIASEYRAGTGETYRESVEAGDPSPWTALATAAPFAAIGFLPDKLIVDTLANAVRKSDPASRNAIREMLTTVGTQTGAQAVSEGGQEEVLIQLRAALDEDFSATSDEAGARREESYVAGAIGGAAVGGVTTGSAQAIETARRMASGQSASTQLSPESQELMAEVETVLNPRVVNRETRDMRDEDIPLPESQRDIDAQFTAMLGENSAKQAVEITEGSPLPSGYQEGMEGVERVDTENGYLLTTDPDVAEMVRVENGSSEAVARALGYATPKQPGMARSVVARNDAGDVVHSELISENEDPNAAMQRARQFAPNVEIQDAVRSVEERAERVRAEGRDPEFEAAEMSVRKADQKLADLQRLTSTLRRARQNPDLVDRWNEFDEYLARAERKTAETQERLNARVATLERMERGRRQQEARETIYNQTSGLVASAMERTVADAPERVDGIEVVDTNTGETTTLPREEYDDLVNRFRTQNDAENITLDDDQVAQRIADEFADRGYEINPTDARPITVSAVRARDAEAAEISERALDPNSAEAYTATNRANINSRVQVLTRKHRMGPQTEATIVDGRRVPTSAVRQLRKLRQKFPEDNWSIIGWQEPQADPVFQVRRERTFSERAGDDPLVRDVDSRDSEAIEMTNTRSFGETDTQDPSRIFGDENEGGITFYISADPTISQSARQQVLASTANARWRHKRRPPPESHYLRMVDPAGKEGYYNPNQIIPSGMDANQYMVGDTRVSEPERKYMGFMTALALLNEAGYKIYTSTVPRFFDGAERNLNQRLSQPYWASAKPDWENLSIQDRFDVLAEAGITEITYRERGPDNSTQERTIDIGQLDEYGMGQLALWQLPRDSEFIDLIKERAFERRKDENSEGRMADNVERPTPARIRNVDVTEIGTLARSGDGIQIDANIAPEMRDIVAQAKQEAGIQQDVFVITERTSNRVIRSLPADVREAIGSDANLSSLVGPMADLGSGLMGRTVFVNGKAIIWINSTMSEAKQSVALAHELGHVSFAEHQADLLSDPIRAERLTRAYHRDRDEGFVKQYDDERFGFEEWYADRFSAWVHGRERLRPDGTARSGRFRQLYDKLRMIAERLRITASRLEAAGSPMWSRRMRDDEVINNFLDGLTKRSAYESKKARERTALANTAMRRINVAARRGEQQQDQRQAERDAQAEAEYRAALEAELEAELAQTRAESDAETQSVPFRPSMIVRPEPDDPVFMAQVDRQDRRQEQGLIQGPLYFVPNDDPFSALQSHPQARIDFSDQLEPRQDGPQDNIRPREDMAPEPEAQQDNIRPREDMAPEPEALQNENVRPRETFERQPAAGGGGAGQGTPPGGNPPPPPDGGEGPNGGLPFDPNSMYEAISGDARRWAGTETFQKMADWVKENLGPFIRGGAKAIRNLTFTDDARLRENGPIGRRIADWFYSDTFHRNQTGRRGYLNAVEMEMGRWINEAESAMPTDTAQANAALAEAQGGLPTDRLSPEAKRIRRFLKRFYKQYLAGNVNGIKMRNDYFPRVYDMSEIVARSGEFTQLLQEAGYSEQEAASVVRSMLNNERGVEMTNTQDLEGTGPGMDARTQRILEKLDDTVLQQRNFLIEPRAALMQYLKSGVKRVEYERRFGGDMPLSDIVDDLNARRRLGHRVDPEYYDSIMEQYNNSANPDQDMRYDPSARLKDQVNRMPLEDQREVRKIIENYMGRSNTLFGAEMPLGVGRAMSAVGGAMYMSTLGLAALSQITDFGAIVMRTRGAEGFGMLHRAFTQIPRDERIAMAKAVGSISHHMNLEALRMTYGNDFMTPTVRRSVDTFFKVIGLEQITNLSRSVATTMGAEFLNVHATKAAMGDPRSRRYLDELRVTPQQVFAWQNNQRRFDTAEGQAVREALFQFTDESILRPNAAMRPGWASNPWFTLMWQLKSFMWGFYKVVVRGLANEVVQRRREGATISDQIAPMALTGAVMLPLAALTMMSRDVAKEGLNSVFDDDEYSWQTTRNRSMAETMLELTDRAGLLGPMTLVNSAYDAHGWGDNPALTLLGPTAERTGQLAQGDFERVGNDMLPVIGLVR